MLSLPKLLLLVIVVALVWFGWRWVARVQTIGRARTEARRNGAAAPTGSPFTPRAASPTDAEDMEKCPECGAYVAPRSAVSCGRSACPYGR
ncbi:hypothetical protein D3877_07550 [Azospirillum cavernae]|uniref:Uncharacterized protein n=1 Tax=Azospirillum cavernae TaxID=2320860 RepID=A0A418W2Z5_9PROT|nr:hypothetical protein [Azospirillum cavernae]RJF84402.1 hypothetical protein D3877_07550 [Azospirillum cavernae]